MQGHLEIQDKLPRISPHAALGQTKWHAPRREFICSTRQFYQQQIDLL